MRLVAAPVRASDEIIAVEGTAVGLFAHIAIVGGPEVIAGPTPSVAIPPTGGSESDTVASVTQPPVAAGILEATAEGSLGPDGVVNATASAADVAVTDVLSADLIESSCHADTLGVVGVSTLTNFDFGGQNLEANPPVNTVIDVPGVGSVTLNEQIQDGDRLTVRAVHATIDTGRLTGEVIVAESVCGATVLDSSTGDVEVPGAIPAEPAFTG